MDNKQTSTTDDQLVTMHRKARVRKKRKLIITLVVVLAVALIGITLAVVLLRRSVNQKINESNSSEVQSAEVSIGSIKTTVSGSGTLASEDVEDMEVLSSLEIVDYYVGVSDYVEEGDLIATVTNASLLTAMSDKQAELDALDEELKEASGDEISSSITASVAGRVKLIHVETGDDVATAMYDHGALMLLSLDGYMAVEVASDNLAVDDIVTATLSDGSSVEGIVEKQLNGTATILVTDNGTTYGDSVTVYDGDGTEVGTGTLKIHSQMAVVGYAGTVSSVNVSENESVSSGETLIKLTDTETSANYDTLLKERAELEEDLNALIKIYKEGGVCAAVSGVIETTGETTTTDTATGEMYTAQTDSTTGNSASDTIGGASGGATSGTSSYVSVATIAPDTSMAISISVDETDILSLSVGQEATVSIDSIGEDTYEGTVTEVNTTASSASGVTAYSAVISIDKTENMLSGMSASVVITIEGNDNALLIPVEALHQTSSSAYVYTEYDETNGEYGGMQEVTIGLSNSTYVEIKEGLSEGDVVYYTESEDSSPFGNGMMNFGNMGGDFGGGMPGGGGMPDMGSMPSRDQMSGGRNMRGGDSEN